MNVIRDDLTALALIAACLVACFIAAAALASAGVTILAALEVALS